MVAERGVTTVDEINDSVTYMETAIETQLAVKESVQIMSHKFIDEIESSHSQAEN